jgi:uncharacterized protein YndB with AHSA1/START domain
MTQSLTETTIVREIAIHAPAARVFSALTEPEELVQWWGSDEGYRCTAMERDLRVGGAWRTTGVGSDGETFAVAGVYRAIDPPRLLEYTWNYDWSERADAAETVVRYELEERDGMTHLRVIHSGFVDAKDRDDHDHGWGHVLGWLQAYAERR